MNAEQNVKQLIREEIGDRDANDDIPRPERYQIAQKFGAVPPEFDRKVINTSVQRSRKKVYFTDVTTVMVYNLKVSKPFWMDETTEDGELTWEQKNQEFQLAVNQAVKQITKEQNRLRKNSRPQQRRAPVQPSTFRKLPSQKFQHPSSTRSGN